MTDSDIRRIVSQLNDAWNQQDLEKYIDFFTEDAVYSESGMEVLKGKRAIRNFHAVAFSRKTTRKSELLNVLVNGNQAAVEWRLRGKTVRNRDVDYCGVYVLDLKNGKVKSLRLYFDTAERDRQIGKFA